MTNLTGLPRRMREPGGLLDANPFENWPTQVRVHVELEFFRVDALRHGTLTERQDVRKSVQDMADHCLGLCENLELESAARDYEFIRDDLHEGRLRDDDKLADRLDEAARAFRADLRDRRFFRVTRDRQSYFGADFGQAVTDAFPSAAFDIREANTCFALERYTATVFHLMRAAEIGLRVLAWDRRVRVKHKGKKSRRPLELEMWDKILDGLEDAEAEIEGYTKTKAREAQLAFYHGAMVQLRAFKNLFRNRIMHARESYDEAIAKGALGHVRDFLQLLAVRVSETQRTPKRWTNKWLGIS